MLMVSYNVFHIIILFTFIYTTFQDQAPAIFSTSYQDFYSSNITSPLAEIRCQSQYSTPTSVIWYRNGRNVNFHNGYKQSSVVLNRKSFAYDNILRVYDIHGILGNNTYTCSIQNVIGQDIEIIHMDNTGM